MMGPERCTIRIDPEHRWTNANPANYIERRLACQNCGVQRRFAPIDEKIPSIPVESLKNFNDSVRGFSQEVPLQRLQELSLSAEA